MSDHAPLQNGQFCLNVGSNEAHRSTKCQYLWQFFRFFARDETRMVTKLIHDWHQWYKIPWLEVPRRQKTAPWVCRVLLFLFAVFCCFQWFQMVHWDLMGCAKWPLRQGRWSKHPLVRSPTVLWILHYHGVMWWSTMEHGTLLSCKHRLKTRSQQALVANQD